jgi:hypothetical protein
VHERLEERLVRARVPQAHYVECERRDDGDPEARKDGNVRDARQREDRRDHGAGGQMEEPTLRLRAPGAVDERVERHGGVRSVDPLADHLEATARRLGAA